MTLGRLVYVYLIDLGQVKGRKQPEVGDGFGGEVEAVGVLCKVMEAQHPANLFRVIQRQITAPAHHAPVPDRGDPEPVEELDLQHVHDYLGVAPRVDQV